MRAQSTAARRVVTGLGAVALAFAGIVSVSTAAHAAPGPDQPNAPANGTLTVNKYAGGHTSNPKPEDLLSGVEFTVTQIGRGSGSGCVPLSLANPADWNDIETLFSQPNTAPVTVSAPFCKTSTTQVKSTVAGQAKFDLAVGVYLVQETAPGSNPIVSKVPDFFVSIPTSEGAEGSGWNYDVVANPKNQLAKKPSKTIENQTDLVVGGKVNWTLTVPVPSLNNNDKFTSASVTDVLDSRLSYDSSVVKLGSTTLAAGTDYNVDDAGVTWTFTQTGREKLDAAQGQNIEISLVTTVDEVGDGSIPNKDYSSSFNDAKVPGDKIPYTYWGQLEIKKTDNSKPAALPLKGAEFKVFNAANASGACPATVPTTGAIATGESDDNGVVRWAGVTPTSPLGLWVANSADGPLTNPSKVYCVYETKVPAGHTAVPFAPERTITAGAPVDGTSSFTVVNNKKIGPNLPLTGSTGTAALVIGGIVLVAAGATAIVVTRRRNHADLG